LKPRAFVVMPFGKKPLNELPNQTRDDAAKPAGLEIDFEAVYNDLLAPALGQAGCDPFRADCVVSAGDIRTDMFFELVAADLVIADIPIPNPNVFYELGVRHGVCPHGVLVVQGNFVESRPFDVAPDRSFGYDGSLFVHSQPDDPAHAHKLSLEVERLSRTFKHAMGHERESIGSPVYEHLPGLVPVKWDDIQTSKAKYFGSLRDDWLDCVRMAQLQGRPGDIETLADDAPTLLHRTMILYQAALALIDLCRYSAAERQLCQVTEHNPNHFEAQLQLGRVLSHQGKTDQAEHHLRSILCQHEDEPYAGDLLGQVSRHLWHLSWRDEPEATRKEKAIATSQLAALAVRNFVKAQQYDPRAYFAGFNAIILIALLDYLRESTGTAPAEIWPAHLDELVRELTTDVQFCARNSRERAIEKGDYVEQFWTTTTLAGIAMIKSDLPMAKHRIKEACSIPGATFFQLHTFYERLSLYDELCFQPEFVKSALNLVNDALAKKHCGCPLRKVFLWAGYPVDKKALPKPRFPLSALDAVKKEIDAALTEWAMKKGDLAICAGVTEGDILFSEACLKKEARVRLMLLEPVGPQLHQALWPFRSDEWERRFRNLLSKPDVDVWFHSEHLGAALDENTPHGRQSVRRRHTNWLINTARSEAEPATDPTSREAPDFAPRLYGLFLWNEEGDAENSEDPSYLIRLVNEFNGFEGQVKTINPEKYPPIRAEHESAAAG
jgi:tetratricopeptide (TPR) repeat protein